MWSGNQTYLLGTALQVYAYTRSGVRFDVACGAGIVYWIALWAGWKMGLVR